MQNFTEKNFPFWLLTSATFLVLLLPELVQNGMFVDGITYAAVSKNLANGLGSFWNLHYSKTLYNSFHEHPPLVFGLQSIFFYIFGDGIYTERIYTFLTAAITGLLIIKFWRKIFDEHPHYKQLGWLPLLLWITVPLVSWSYKNNMLENTMGIFTLAAVYFIYLGVKSKPFLNFPIAGLFILAAFFSKGLVALFPLCVIFLSWISKKNSTFRKMILQSAIIAVLFLIFFLFIIFLIPDAYNSLVKYFDIQVLKSLRGEREVTDASRIYILERLINELLASILLSILVLAICYYKRLQSLLLKNNYKKDGLFLALTGLSASLPILISPKQMGYYLVPSFPFFALAFAIFLAPAVHKFINWIKITNRGFKFYKTCVFVLFFASLFLVFIKIGKTVRDKELLQDVNTIGKIVPKGEIITIQDDMCGEWSVIAYFSRYFYISLDCENKKNKYQIIKKYGKAKFEEDYEKVPLELNNFVLLEMKK